VVRSQAPILTGAGRLRLHLAELDAECRPFIRTRNSRDGALVRVPLMRMSNHLLRANGPIDDIACLADSSGCNQDAVEF